MKLQLNASAVLALAAVGVVGVLAWRASRVASDAAGALSRGVSSVVDAVNPTSDKNIFYQGANAIGGAVTGQGEDFSLGTWLYNVTHGDVLAEQPKPPVNTGGATGSWDESPADPFNIPGLPPYFGA